MSSPKKSPSKMMGQPLPAVGGSSNNGPKKSLAQKLYMPLKEPTEHTAPAALHIQKTMSHSDEAVILVSGGGGGVSGPGDSFIALADHLAKKANLPTIRLDYKESGPSENCKHDILGSMAYLKDKYGVSQFLLVGWSSGAGSALALAAEEERIVAVATIASKDVDASLASKLAPRPLLVITDKNEDSIHDAYGAKGDKNIKVIQEDQGGDGSKYAAELEDAITAFACKTLHKQTPSSNGKDK